MRTSRLDYGQFPSGDHHPEQREKELYCSWSSGTSIVTIGVVDVAEEGVLPLLG